MNSILGRCCVLILIGVLSVRGAAENPGVTLSVEQVTLAEAAAAVSRATGIPVRLAFEDPSDPGPRLAFSWIDRPFSQILRDLAQRYDAAVSRGGGGSYVLQPGGGGPPLAQAGRTGSFRSGHHRMWVNAVTVVNNRSLRFDGQEVGEDESQLLLEIGGRLDSGEADSIAGLRNVVALDDLGNRLMGELEEGERNVYTPALPDEWMGSIRIPSPHPRARRLRWLRGEVHTFSRYSARRFETPVPDVNQTSVVRVGNVTLTLTRLPAPPPAPEGSPLPTIGVLIRSRLTSEAGPGWSAVHEAESLAPLLVDEKGTWSEPVTLNATSLAAPIGQEGEPMEFECGYSAPIGAKPRLAYYLVNKSAPVRLFSFQLADIPLPQERPFRPHRLTPAAAANLPESPLPAGLHSPGGGTLRLRVLIEGKRPAAGALHLAVSRRETGRWSAVRRFSAPMGDDGEATLHDLLPGRYRIERRFEAASGSAPAGKGSWNGASVEVDVLAGRECVPPPLAWTRSTSTGGPSHRRSGAP